MEVRVSTEDEKKDISLEKVTFADIKYLLVVGE